MTKLEAVEQAELRYKQARKQGSEDEIVASKLALDLAVEAYS